MGKLSTFEILVDSPRSGHFKPGDTLNGQVVLELREDLEVDEVKIRFIGKALVQWSEPRKSPPIVEIQGSRSDPEFAEEVYIDDTRKLFPAHHQHANRRKVQSSSTLRAGLHSLDFQFRIPSNAPGSFSATQGHVRYELRAVVERPWKLVDNTRVIYVDSHSDLNDVSGAGESVDVSNHLKTNSLLRSSADCRATMRLTKKGFVPGEVIPVQYCLQNYGHQDVNKVWLQLSMFVTYKVHKKRFVHQFPLGRSDLGKVPAGKTMEDTDYSLCIPKMCKPTGLPGCKLMSVKYQLQLKVKPSFLSGKRLKLNTQVIVGTKPLQDQPCQDTPPDYWSCFPPSYEEATAKYPPHPRTSSSPYPRNSTTSPDSLASRTSPLLLRASNTPLPVTVLSDVCSSMTPLNDASPPRTATCDPSHSSSTPGILQRDASPLPMTQSRTRAPPFPQTDKSSTMTLQIQTYNSCSFDLLAPQNEGSSSAPVQFSNLFETPRRNSSTSLTSNTQTLSATATQSDTSTMKIRQPLITASSITTVSPITSTEAIPNNISKVISQNNTSSLAHSTETSSVAASKCTSSVKSILMTPLSKMASVASQNDISSAAHSVITASGKSSSTTFTSSSASSESPAIPKDMVDVKRHRRLGEIQR